MGLIASTKRLILALFFLIVGVVSYFASEATARSAEEHYPMRGVVEAFDRESVRRALVKAIETDASSDHRQLIEQLARMAPIDPLPYEAALSNALAHEDTEVSDKMAARVLALQPRSLTAHLHMLNTAAQRGEHEAVIAHYERLIELKSLNSELLTDALVGVFGASNEWGPLLHYLKKQPTTGELIVARLMEQPIDPADLQAVLESYPKLQTSYLNMLIKSGAYQQSLDAWSKFSNISNQQDKIPFNGSFASVSEPPPFNWSIDQNRAEVQERGGLYVTYLGSGSPLIASQILAAPANTYLLKTHARGRMPENGGVLEWRVQCLDIREDLLRAPISLSRIGEQEMFESEITIPDQDCEFQKLELRGRAGEFPKTSKTEILFVSLTAADE